jgi:hypothetical protein
VTIRLTEVLVDEIVTALTADLVAAVPVHRALAPAFTAAAMPLIAEVTHGARQNHATPAIEVIPGRSPIIHDGREALTFRHRIVIGVFAEHADEGQLQRLLERYTACVIQVLMNRRAGANGGLTFTLQFSTEDGSELDWGAVRVNDRTLFQQDVFFAVIANADDSR